MRVARTHLVWDWNGTLLDDFALVVTATNHAFAAVGARDVTPDEHRRRFRRPVAEFYAEILERAVDEDEFGKLDRIFHDAYRLGLTTMALAADAKEALTSWPGSQSLLSMWFHAELVPTLETYGLAGHFTRVDGLRTEVGGDLKAGHLAAHLREMDVTGAQTVLIGDSLDDAAAASSNGAAVVLYTGGFTDATRLRTAGCPVADTLVEAVEIARTL
ncbi:HAD hydrolase-like protein [Actinoplanes sp. NBRC 103695]|uniref:HAD family hydrolase n=1 Tax=Actinoplanes sp. NBRC 103695 TaxID=3032202 RepID=UPI0025552A41|nr:HAD hydrolase-like protein [Actinoplanes sp. NBRC 103695]